MKKLQLVLFFIFIPSVHASCIDQTNDKVPQCPVGKTNARDDTYPAAYVTIGPGKPADHMDADFAVKAFKAGGPTKIILSGRTAAEFDNSKLELKKLGYSEDQINDRFILYPNGTRYQWQQDFVQAEFDSKTGASVMRPINGYMTERVGESNDHSYFDQLTEFLNSKKVFCSGVVATGPLLPKESNASFDSTRFGGNMEGFPGGLCLVGDTLPDASLKDFCKGNPQLAVKIPASWLHVGHVDELISVVKDNTAKPPCNFAVLRASPLKALDLLKNSMDNSASANAKFQALDKGELVTDQSLCSAWQAYNNKLPTRVVPPEVDSKKSTKAV